MHIKKIRVASIIVGCFLMYQPVMADDDTPIIRGDETCQSARFITDYADKFRRLKDEQTDTVQMVPIARLVTSEDIPHMPDRVYQKDGDNLIDWALAKDGTIKGFDSLTTASQSAQICTFDPKRAGLDITEDGLNWDIAMDIQFVSAKGTHSMDVLEDGLRDGRTHYKKAAGTLSLFVPKMTHLMIRPVHDDVAVEPIAMQKGEIVGPLKLDEYCGLQMVPMKALKDVKAHQLIIRGGAYRLLPVPGPKAMDRFAGCDDDS